MFIFLLVKFIFLYIFVIIFCQAELNYQECGVMEKPRFAGPSTSAGHHPVSLISGGTLAQTYENLFPWMAKIRIKSGDPEVGGSCSATIVGHRWIMTASHCVGDGSDIAKYFKVGVGSSSVKEMEDWYSVKKLHKYPIWKTWSFPGRNFDIALLELPEGRHLELGENVRKICLPICYSIVNGRKSMVMGWGDVHWDKSGQRLQFRNVYNEDMLKYGTIEMGQWGTNECDDQYRNPWYFCGAGNSSSMLWTLPAHGDSGGAVVVMTPNPNDPNMVIYYQIGIISGRGTDLGLPLAKMTGQQIKYRDAAYLAVDHFCEWIRITTKEEVKCQKIEGG